MIAAATAGAANKGDLSGRRLHLPEGLRYTCHQSGLCCPVFPRIPVDQASADRLDSLDYGRMPSVGCGVKSAEEATLREPDGTRVLARRRDGGDCVFYGADGLCAVHKTHGEAAKPQVCRDFPYRYRDTPGGRYVGLSFVCPSVRGNKGQPVTEQGDDLLAAGDRAHRRQTAEGLVRLNRKLLVSWNDYLALESALADLLGLDGMPLARRMAACAVLLTFVDLLQQGLHGPHAPMAAARAVPDGEIAEAVAAMARNGYADVLRAAGRHVAGGARKWRVLRRMYLGMVAGLGNTLWAPKGRFATVVGLIADHVKHATGLGRVRMKPFSRPVGHDALARAAFPAAGPGAELLDRYLGHCLFRKDLVFAPDVARGLNLWLTNAALLRWYAAAVAAEAGRATPEDDDWSEAVRHVETYYGMQSRFYETLAKHDHFESILDGFTRRKNFPFVVMG